MVQLLIFLFNFENDQQNLSQYFHLITNNYDQIIISDFNNNNIQLYENDGEFIDKFGKKGENIGEFHYPSGISFDLNYDNLLICDSGNHQIQKIKI